LAARFGPDQLGKPMCSPDPLTQQGEGPASEGTGGKTGDEKGIPPKVKVSRNCIPASMQTVGKQFYVNVKRRRWSANICSTLARPIWDNRFAHLDKTSLIKYEGCNALRTNADGSDGVNENGDFPLIFQQLIM